MWTKETEGRAARFKVAKEEEIELLSSPELEYVSSGYLTRVKEKTY